MVDVERRDFRRVQWMERLLRPWYEQVLVQTVLPEIDGLIESLNADLGLRTWMWKRRRCSDNGSAFLNRSFMDGR